MDSSAATTIWRELETGTWKVVDQLQRDHRRYLLAQENAPSARKDSALTARERQVVEYTSLGWSNKVIAYELGVSSSTVSTHLSHAAAKLGLKSRAALIQMVLALAGTPSSEITVSHVGWAGRRFAVLALPEAPRLPETLSPAERDVVALAVEGTSNAAIAKARGVSVRTVENQLATAMKKLAVTSRANLTAYLMAGRRG